MSRIKTSIAHLRIVFAALGALAFLVPIAVRARSSPSVYVDPAANFAAIQRIAVFPFSSTSDDPFAGTKATALIQASLSGHGIEVVAATDIVSRIQSASGHTFSNPLSQDDAKLIAQQLPKYVDAVVIGHVSAWGTISETGTRLISVPSYGSATSFGSSTGIAYGPNVGAIYTSTIGSASTSWNSWQTVPITVSRPATVIGATVAMLQLSKDGLCTLAWEYNNTDVEEGGPFRWNHPPSADDLGKRFIDGIVQAFPLKAQSSPEPLQSGAPR